MKIVNKDESHILIKDGNITTLIIGFVLILIAIGVGYYSYFTKPDSTVLLVSGLLGLSGIIVIFTSSSITLAINKTSGLIDFQKKRLLGKKENSYKLQDVMRVELRRSYLNDPSINAQPGMPTRLQKSLNYQCLILMKDGTEIPLENQKNSGTTYVGGAVLMGGIGQHTAMANEIATFMNVPFQEVG